MSDREVRSPSPRLDRKSPKEKVAELKRQLRSAAAERRDLIDGTRAKYSCEAQAPMETKPISSPTVAPTALTANPSSMSKEKPTLVSPEHVPSLRRNITAQLVTAQQDMERMVRVSVLTRSSELS